MMHTIAILNPKGGCGKSTIAMNLAGYCAMQDKRVALADCDPQSSSADWLRQRPKHLAKIRGVPAKAGQLHVPDDTEILILDTVARMDKLEIATMIRIAQTMIIPVLPSPIDIRAAERFLVKLSKVKKKTKGGKIKVVTVANRVREKTLASQKLNEYLGHLKVPGGKKIKFLTTLRASQNYIHAAEQGITIFELPPSKTAVDLDQWRPLCNWVRNMA